MENYGGGWAIEGETAGGHLIKHCSEAEQVGAGVEGLAAGLLGRHVGDGAVGRAGAGEHGAVEGRAGGDAGLLMFLREFG